MSEICLRCGRKLKSDKSKDCGYGEICYKKSHQEEELQEEKKQDLNKKLKDFGF